ncbi:MAG TPA: trypsin-like peptidase domain-containing protein [Solirubrobacteraceae bacterium]|jgi:V8-like Glu-specific endopeptidase|nr:trypsin-like peptidase domain-containing protein [Solirubrobacteraceae bacterium]
MSPGKLAIPAVMAALALGLPAVALAIHLRASGRAHTARGRRIPVSHTTSGVSEVGPLFANATTTQHGCTASVVDSPNGDVVLTAAHCVSGSGVGMVFAPGFHNGSSPYGRWTVTASHLALGWLKSQDPQTDFAFLTVAPQPINGRLKEIEQVTGGFLLGGKPRAGEAITVLGYPAGSDNAAISCRTSVYFTDAFPSFDCRGYVGGTSGGPWLVQSARGARIVGVIGGLNQGGCVDSTSYSSLLAQTARKVYAKASHHATPDVAPAPGGDGC